MNLIPKTQKPSVVEVLRSDGLRVEQTSTRGDGSVELEEEFERDSIDYSAVLDHIAIHTEGEVAGSQFNGDIFDSPEAVCDMLSSALPDTLQYDQHGRAELTLALEDTRIGYTGIKPLDEIEGLEGVRITRSVRIPGGEAAEVDGVKGAWFPEVFRNPETGRFEVALNPDGSIKNPHGKFEPEAWIAEVDEGAAAVVSATNRLTAIIQKNPKTGLPSVLTAFPGENAPAFPAKIEGESFQLDTLSGGAEAAYWAEHTFVRSS